MYKLNTIVVTMFFPFSHRQANSMASDFCIESATQLSLDFFCATPACACQSPGSADQDCEVYGGQCTCIEVEAEQGFTAVLGRQCNLCPFYSYLTPDGCTCKNMLVKKRSVILYYFTKDMLYGYQFLMYIQLAAVQMN